MSSVDSTSTVDAIPAAPPDRTSQLAASVRRFQSELQNVVQATGHYDVLLTRLLTTTLRRRNLIGGCCYRINDESAKPVATGLDHPALQHDSLINWIEQAARTTVSSGQSQFIRSPQIRNLMLMTLPCASPDATATVLCLLWSCDSDNNNHDAQLFAAHAVGAAVENWMTRHHLLNVTEDLRVTAGLLEINSSIEQARDLTTAALHLVVEIKTYLDAERVIIGVCPRGRRTTRLLAISDQPRLDPESTLSRLALAAMDETVARETPASWPLPESGVSSELLALRALAEALPVENVSVMPLIANDECIGAICVAGVPDLQAGSEVLSEATRFVLTAGEPIGTAIEAVRRRQPGPVLRLFRRLASQSKVRRFAVATALVGLVAVLSLPLPYRIACGFQCEPVMRSFSVAPYNGLLETTLVRPGDLVAAGDLLARMDDSEIHLELGELEADRFRAAKERDVHLAEENVAKSFMSALEADRITHRRNLLLSRLEQLEIRSQTAGVVLAGEVDRRENLPVSTGQMLFEVASLSPMRIDVAVPDDDIEQVRVGMKAELRVDSLRTELLTGNVIRIRPRSETVDQANVFIAEVELANEDGILRPGMKGSARIISDRHPLAWNLFHRAWEHTTARILW